MRFLTAFATLAIASVVVTNCNSSLSSSPTSPVRAVNPEIERMKQCAKDAKKARMRWFYEETGLTTTADSGAAQSYYNQMKSMGISTKTPIPSPLCG